MALAAIATVPIGGFRVCCPWRVTDTSGGSSLVSLPFGRPSLLPLLLRHRLTPSRLTSATPAASRRRKNGGSSTDTRHGKASKKPTKQSQPKKRLQLDDEDTDDDAFEALFSMLEEDLKNDNSIDDDADDDITEEDFKKFEKELSEVIDEIDNQDKITEEDSNKSEKKPDQVLDGTNNLDDEITEDDLNKFEDEFDEELDEDVDVDVEDDDNYDYDDDDDDDEEEDEDEDEDEEEEEEEEDDEDEDEDEDGEEDTSSKLKRWQIRSLAAALKQGRRKIGIKNLAAELGLDRAVVLQLLREPPPQLLLMSASLPDKKPEAPLPIQTESKQVEPPIITPKPGVTKADEPKKAVPMYEMQSRWLQKKRIKKVHVETMEKVYSRTKRPTNAMISSIVQLTNLPRKTVVQWFEDKRTQDGVPKTRSPYYRSVK